MSTEQQRQIQHLKEDLKEARESTRYQVYIKAMQKIIYLEDLLQTSEQNNQLLLNKLKQYQLLVGDISVEEYVDNK